MNDLAPAQRLLHVVAGSGLNPDDATLRKRMFGGDRAAGNQPAAADTHQQHIERADVFYQFERRSTLTRHHVRMIKRRNQCHAALLRPMRGRSLRGWTL